MAGFIWVKQELDAHCIVQSGNVKHVYNLKFNMNPNSSLRVNWRYMNEAVAPGGYAISESRTGFVTLGSGSIRHSANHWIRLDNLKINFGMNSFDPNGAKLYDEGDETPRLRFHSVVIGDLELTSCKSGESDKYTITDEPVQAK